MTTPLHTRAREETGKRCQFLRRRIAANSITEAALPAVCSLPEDVALVASVAANESPWVRLVPHGEYPHPSGIQVVDTAATAAMAQRFNGWLSKLQSFANAVMGMGAGTLPVYQGHPDDGAHCLSHEDTEVYQRVAAMESRHDGLYVQFETTAAGQALLTSSNARLYYSPRWVMAPVPGRRDAWRPVKLLSVGLTPTPNLPRTVAAAANAQEPRIDQTMTYLTQLLQRLGFDAARSQATADGGIDAVSLTEASNAIAALEASRDQHRTAANALSTGISTLLTELGVSAEQMEALDLDTLDADAVTEIVAQVRAALNLPAMEATAEAANALRERVVELEVERAVAANRIAAANAEQTRADLLAADDLLTAANALREQAPEVDLPNGQQRTAGVAAAEPLQLKTAANARAAFLDKVTEYQANGLGYAQAYDKAKREHTDLYAAAYGAAN